ncbi:hypothetical protein M231_05692 [Tremella mesenterica]|uniref:Uncharacterized protein n=1 Tax=Tremella mesenterica TaxID=5217 RepID=A0A4Q1BHF6_TREME|nr:hypothetical protein M231_05692 [Tremella mesenterica]
MQRHGPHQSVTSPAASTGYVPLGELPRSAASYSIAPDHPSKSAIQRPYQNSHMFPTPGPNPQSRYGVHQPGTCYEQIRNSVRFSSFPTSLAATAYPLKTTLAPSQATQPSPHSSSRAQVHDAIGSSQDYHSGVGLTGRDHVPHSSPFQPVTSPPNPLPMRVDQRFAPRVRVDPNSVWPPTTGSRTHITPATPGVESLFPSAGATIVPPAIPPSPLQRYSAQAGRGVYISGDGRYMDLPAGTNMVVFGPVVVKIVSHSITGGSGLENSSVPFLPPTLSPHPSVIHQDAAHPSTRTQREEYRSSATNRRSPPSQLIVTPQHGTTSHGTRGRSGSRRTVTIASHVGRESSERFQPRHRDNRPSRSAMRHSGDLHRSRGSSSHRRERVNRPSAPARSSGAAHASGHNRHTSGQSRTSLSTRSRPKHTSVEREPTFLTTDAGRGRDLHRDKNGNGHWSTKARKSSRQASYHSRLRKPRPNDSNSTSHEHSRPASHGTFNATRSWVCRNRSRDDKPPHH